VNDEFYIGYEPQMPEGIAKRIRPAAIGLIALALTLPAVLVVAQKRFSSGIFEYGRERTIEGRLIATPYPALLVAETSEHVAMTYWLVGPGKHGAADIVRGLDGHLVRVTGSLIARDADSMIEVASGHVVAIDTHTPPPLEPIRSLGPVVMRGEIVDSKCHLGVMKPGEGPAHRDCAVRCLLGSVTPMFVPSGHDRATGRLALVDPDGQPFTGSLETIAGRPLRVRGTLLARGPQRFLAIERSAIAVAGDESE
jgi:hypothetical protein